MKVNYIFADGREQLCSIPDDFPLDMVGSIINNTEQGVIAVEVHGD